MNSLNLRVSSVKTGENIRKNAELRTSKIQLPANCIAKYRTRDFLAVFQSAKTLPDQVQSVKNIYDTHFDELDALQFLSELYFVAPLKHPVRNQITKLLRFYRLYNESQVLSALNYATVTLLGTVNEKKSCQKLNMIVTSLSGCFENFPIALRALQQNLDEIFQFLQRALLQYTTNSGLQFSPAARNEIYLFIHNLIRFILALVQEFISNLSENVKKIINSFKYSLCDLILDADMPMDVKTNCGNLISYTCKMNDDYIRHIKNVSSESIDEENNCLVLCYCIGVINTISSDDFQSASKEVKVIVEKVCKIANKYSTEPSMLLGAVRILFQMSKLLVIFDVSDSSRNDIKSIQQSLTQVVLSYLEHHMDSVRHICKDMIRNIIKINSKFAFNNLLDDLFEFSMKNDTAESLKCAILIAISNTLGTNEILKRFPNVVQDIIANGLGDDLSTSNCYENLMNSNHKEVELEKWKTTWITPLIRLSHKDKKLLELVEILINKAIKCDPKIVDFLVDSSETDIALSTRLSALWTIRKNGLQKGQIQNYLENLSNVLKDAMTSNDDDTKIMALRLVVESHKTTEVMSTIECETIFEFLKYNSNCQSPAIRQRSLALISKGLVRLSVCFERSLKEKSNSVDYYREFLQKFITLLVGNLFLGANFSRRSVSLVLLEQTLKILHNCRQNVHEFMPENSVLKLVDVLNDSYESNKAKAISILRLIIMEDSKQFSLDFIRDLMTSVRPTDSMTAAYYLEYYCIRGPSSTEFPNHKMNHGKYLVEFAAISWCIEILEDGLDCAHTSILRAARENPLYGSVLSIKHLLAQLKFQDLSNDIEWRNIFSKLIKLCKSLTQVVGPIVNNSSPEGHLPSDFSEIPEYLGETETQQNYERNFKVLSSKQNPTSGLLRTTPQMVLLCAWRTIKEVSLLLGEIVLRSPIQSPNKSNDFLITAEQIIEIGNHFKQLLSETKHRGAFEQAYVGFSKVCTRLWRTDHPQLYKLPMIWLDELIDVISKDEKINEKICATRRSAGIPFMVQALITSELQVGTTKALTCCMKHLIHLCSDCNKSTESRTHALNILRALFRCSDLNEAVGEYIADGVMCAIRGYSANTWSERNSSTLLFSALITRVFGVQRTRDWEKLTIRNRMTGRIFFLRYPQLYDFFLDELKEASMCIEKNERPAKLQPLLLILNRLYPSALEGTESYLKISSFIDYISSCSGSGEMTTRHLTARAIVALLTVDSIESRIVMIFELIQENCNTIRPNQNYIHGLLLQILYMLKSHRNLDVIRLDLVVQNVNNLCKTLKPNPITWKVCLDIILEIFKRRNTTDLSMETASNLIPCERTHLIYNSEFSRLYPVFRKSFFLYNLYIVTAKKKACDDFLKFISNCFETFATLSYEEVETLFNILLLILFNDDDNVATIYECNENEKEFVDTLDLITIAAIQKELKSSLILPKFINEICSDRIYYPECTIKAYAVLSRLPNLGIQLAAFIRTSGKYPDDVRNSMVLCIESYVQNRRLDENELEECLELLEILTLPWSSDLLRLTAAKITHHICIQLFSNSLAIASGNLIKLINTILCLLRDDDADVRDHICKTVVCISGIDKEDICASYAPVVLCHHLSGVLKQMAEVDFTITVLQGIIAAQLDESYSIEPKNEDENDGEVFDKNEANVFAEPYKTFMDSVEVFLECFRDDPEILGFIGSLCEKLR